MKMDCKTMNLNEFILLYGGWMICVWFQSTIN